MATDLIALAAKIERLSPSDLFSLAAQLCLIGKSDQAELLGEKAVEKLAAKRLGLVK